MGPFTPLADLSFFWKILVFYFLVLFFIDKTDGKAGVDQNVFWLVDFDSPVSNEEIPVDIACEFGNENPVVASVDVIVVTDDYVFATVDCITTTSDNIVVLTKGFVEFMEVSFC
jgi:hypothetical protein